MHYAKEESLLHFNRNALFSECVCSSCCCVLFHLLRCRWHVLIDRHFEPAYTRALGILHLHCRLRVFPWLRYTRKFKRIPMVPSRTALYVARKTSSAAGLCLQRSATMFSRCFWDQVLESAMDRLIMPPFKTPLTPISRALLRFPRCAGSCCLASSQS